MTRGLTFHQLMVGLLFGALATCACLMPAQVDTFWHLRAGQDIWRTLRVPLDDHYSYTAAGRFWPNHEWLWQAASYGLFGVGGPRLLVAGGAAMVIGAAAIVYRLMVGPTSTRFVLMLLGFPLVSCFWVMRPQIASQLLLAVLLWALVTERYLVLPILFVVWANVHGGVAMGGLVLGAATVLALVRARGGDGRDRRRALVLGLVTPICALATALTPLGFRLWRFIGPSLLLLQEYKIVEWQPTLHFRSFGIAFWILAAAFVALAIWRRRFLRTAPWGDTVLTVGALVVLPLAFRIVRNTPVFLLIAMPAASRLLGPDFVVAGKRSRPASVEHPRLNVALLAGISLAEVVCLLGAWNVSNTELGWRPLSAGALAAVRACPAQIYNGYNEGGYLIWLAPEKRVFLDSRQDPYPPWLMKDLTAIEGGAPYRPTFDRYGIRCAFVPARSKTGDRLRGDGWLARFADEKWAVLVAPGVG